MRTPEEIKKGLECCMNYGDCSSGCPYNPVKDCGASLYGDALAYIQKFEAEQPKWISTKDRLPEEPGGILICVFGSIVTFATLKENGVLVTKNFDVWNINDSCVTHWMPLPEPPKEDKGE